MWFGNQAYRTSCQLSMVRVCNARASYASCKAVYQAQEWVHAPEHQFQPLSLRLRCCLQVVQQLLLQAQHKEK